MEENENLLYDKEFFADFKKFLSGPPKLRGCSDCDFFSLDCSKKTFESLMDSVLFQGKNKGEEDCSMRFMGFKSFPKFHDLGLFTTVFTLSNARKRGFYCELRFYY